MRRAPFAHLRRQFGVVGNELDGLFVGAYAQSHPTDRRPAQRGWTDRSVAARGPDEALLGTRRSRVDVRPHGQRAVRDVVVDADHEVILPQMGR
jgi:hypothetical protein